MGTTSPLIHSQSNIFIRLSIRANEFQFPYYKCSQAILSLLIEELFIFSAESLVQHPVQRPDFQHPHHRHHQAHRPTLRRTGASRSQQAGVSGSEAGA